MSWSAPNSILILRLSALGDILHTMPAAAALRRQWPNARIGWVVERHILPLLEGNPLVDRVHVIDTRRARALRTFLPGIASIFKLVWEVRSSGYELAFDFQGLFKSAVLAWLSGAGRRVGFSQQSRRERLSAWFSNEHVQLPVGNKHVIEIYQALVEACGVSTGKFEFPLPPTPMQEQYVKAQLDRHQLRNFIVINPGAGWVTKMWAAANYALLGKRIQKELKLPVIFTWGPQEEHLIAEIRSVIGQAHCIDFPTTFLDLIPLLQRAQLFIGGDTGPMQLAAALGIPIVAIFSSTNPDRNGPFSPQDISVHRKLFCSNCYLRQCPYRLECLEISVDEVFSAVQTRLVSAIK